MKTTLGSVSQDNNYDKMAAIMAAGLEVSEPLKIPCRSVSPFLEFRFETNNFISSLVFGALMTFYLVVRGLDLFSQARPVRRIRIRKNHYCFLLLLLLHHFYCLIFGFRQRERNVLFNDALNTFYLRLYGVRHMVKKGNPLPPHRLLLSINSKGSFICTIPQTG